MKLRLSLSVAVSQQHQILPSVFHVKDYVMSSGFRKSGGPCVCEILGESV